MIWMNCIGFMMGNNGWRYGLVKADHYRTIEEINFNSAFINYTACYKLGGKTQINL